MVSKSIIVVVLIASAVGLVAIVSLTSARSLVIRARVALPADTGNVGEVHVAFTHRHTAPATRVHVLIGRATPHARQFTSGLGFLP